MSAIYTMALVPAAEFDNLCRVIGESQSLACKEALYKLRRRLDEQHLSSPVKVISDDLTGALSAREKEVADLVCDGMTSADISGLIGIAEKSVNACRSRIYRKMGVRNTAGLVSKMRAPR